MTVIYVTVIVLGMYNATLKEMRFEMLDMRRSKSEIDRLT